MTDTSWPRESDATIAVEAAARKVYDAFREATNNPELPLWDDVDMVVRRNIKDSILVPVWAALSALPDPRYGAWEEGRAAGSSDTAFESEGFGKVPSTYPHENPYPSGF